MRQMMPEPELSYGELLLLGEAIVLEALPDPPDDMSIESAEEAFQSFVVAALPRMSIQRGLCHESWERLLKAKLITYSTRYFNVMPKQRVSRTPIAHEFLADLPWRVAEVIGAAKGHTSVLDQIARAAR